MFTSSPSLAADAPAVYALFNLGADPHGAKAQAQGLRVMDFVNECVHSIDDMAAVQAKIDVLAHRHTGYGVKKDDFPVGGLCHKIEIVRTRNVCL